MDPDDFAIFMDPQDFGTPFAWKSAAGFSEASGIFSASHQVILPGDFAGVSTGQPVLTVALRDLPADHAQDDAVTVARVSYGVSDIQPDGAGMARVMLERR